MKKECECCGTIFNVRRASKEKNKRFCSKKCSMKQRWKNKEYAKKMSEQSIKLWQNNDHIEKMNKIHTSDEWRTKQRLNQYNYLEKTGWREPCDEIRRCKKCGDYFIIKDNSYVQHCSRSCTASDKSQETREKTSISLREYYGDDIKRKIVSIRMKEYYNILSNRIHISNKIKEYYNDENNRTRASRIKKEWWSDDNNKSKMISALNNHTVLQHKREKMIEKWKDEKYADKFFKSSVKYKEFELPSGRIVKLQGYEPQVLEQLLQIYPENDIVCEVKSINKEIGKILYQYEGKERRYYPDFYIKSTNTIIEVKSQWTFDKWKDKNVAKQKACIEQGFNFEFVIL